MKEGVCTRCNCHSTGADGTTCSPNGQCTCNTGYEGLDCSQCTADHYDSSGVCLGKISLYLNLDLVLDLLVY